MPPMIISSIMTVLTSGSAAYAVRDGNCASTLPRISKPALQKAEIE